VWCSAVQGGAVWCSVEQSDAAWAIVLQGVAVCQLSTQLEVQKMQPSPPCEKTYSEILKFDFAVEFEAITCGRGVYFPFQRLKAFNDTVFALRCSVLQLQLQLRVAVAAALSFAYEVLLCVAVCCSQHVAVISTAIEQQCSMCVVICMQPYCILTHSRRRSHLKIITTAKLSNIFSRESP